MTRPCPGMREAMARAVVGDAVLDGDPTTEVLEERVATLLGKEAGLFFPSGIMANQAALAALGVPGTEVLLEESSHVFHYEEGAVGAHLVGMQLRTIPTPDGRLTPNRLSEALRVPSRFTPLASVLVVENTHLASGGGVMPSRTMKALSEAAARNGLRVHLDGARLWNASVATGEPLSALAAGADTVMVSFSKGLGAPVGSVLAGSRTVLETAWRVRRRLGGGMRQTGMLAAAALYALDHHLDDLARDHARAERFAEEAGLVPGLRARPPESNIVLVDVEDGPEAALELLDEMERRDVRLIRFGKARVRAVFHRDVTDQDLDRAIEGLRAVCGDG